MVYRTLVSIKGTLPVNCKWKWRFGSLILSLAVIVWSIGPIAATAQAQIGPRDDHRPGGDRAGSPATEEAWIEVLPIVGIPGEDFSLGPLFDGDPSPGQVLDYMGGDRTYDGHRGTDFGLLSFTDMEIGVPVVAALEGMVTAAVDGNDDRQTTNRLWQPGNYVRIHHGRDRASYYGHLQKNSVIVKVGQHVRTGQQIANVGSSGNSSGPHLHFECIENRIRIDPFAGPANRTASRWVSLPEYTYPMKTIDAGISVERTVQPMQISRAPLVRAGADWFECWIITLNQTTGIVRRWELVRPDGRVHTTSSEQAQAAADFHHSWWWLENPQLTRGRWTVRVWHDHELAVTLPVYVLDGRTAIPRNRPPKKPQAVLSPSDPEPADVVICRVAFPGVAADPDLDRLRYRYVWSIDGKPLRDVVSATRADYFPAAVANPASELKCQVFSSDGTLSSTPVSLSVRYRESSASKP